MLTNKKIPSTEEIIEILRNLPKETLDSILSQLKKEPTMNNESESTEAHDLVCPQCGSIHVRKNGTVRHKQRYSCYDCHRSFGETTGSVRYKSKHTRETWENYQDCFTMKLPLRETAIKCGIALSTAFFWRHKILDALSANLNSQKLDGVVQADETYIQDNYKGNSNAVKNLKKATAAERRPAYEQNRISGHRHGRGNATHTRGLSKQKVCVPCAIDAEGKTLARAAGKGIVQLNYLEYALGANLTEQVVLVTDKTRASSEFCASHELPIIQLKADSDSRNGQTYNLQKINNMHGRIKRLLFPFKGVATKYLDNYLAWNGFEIKHTGLNRLDLKNELIGAMKKMGKCSTYGDVFKKPLLPFPVVG
jgi:transposase-like protein